MDKTEEAKKLAKEFEDLDKEEPFKDIESLKEDDKKFKKISNDFKKGRLKK